MGENAGPSSPGAAGVPGPGFRTDEVRRHYAGLASAYAAGANAACARAYADLVRRTLGGSRAVIEIGAGTETLLPRLAAPLRIACDLSLPMLRAQRGPVTWHRVAADAQDLPFPDGSCDGVYAVNVLEHVPEPRRLVSQAERLLRHGGRFLAVTPNGDVDRLLRWLEILRLKLPEGPHRFLGTGELAAIGGPAFRVLEHRRFLALPVGPRVLVRCIDAVVGGGHGRGLFQYILLEKRGAGSAP